MKKSFHLRQLLFAGGAFGGRNICGKLSGSPGYSIFDHLDHLDIFDIWSHAIQNPGGCSALKGGTRNKKWCLFVNKDVGMIVGNWKNIPTLAWWSNFLSRTSSNRNSWGHRIVIFGFCPRFDLFNFWSGLMWKAKGHGCWSNLLDRANLGKSLS